MATYNFTIRASDSAGAYADQNFSIDVLRTRIDRFVIACDSGILRSVDGKTWTAEAAPSMDYIDYANRTWVSAIQRSGVSSVVTSTDAVNWKTTALTLPKPSGATAVALQVVKYRGGKWMAFGNCDGPSGRIVEWSSSDLVNWTLVGTYPTGITTQISVSDFEYDPATATTVIYVYQGTGTVQGLYTRVGAGTFTQTAIAGNVYGTIQYRNGLWMTTTTSQTLLLSRDGVTWFSRVPGNNQLVTGVTFNNGQLAAYCYGNSTGSYQVLQSLDGAITWNTRFTIGSGGAPRHTIGAYGGTLVMATTSQLFYYSEGGTITNANQTMFAGAPRYVATRQA